MIQNIFSLYYNSNPICKMRFGLSTTVPTVVQCSLSMIPKIPFNNSLLNWVLFAIAAYVDLLPQAIPRQMIRHHQ